MAEAQSNGGGAGYRSVDLNEDTNDKQAVLFHGVDASGSC
jgi:hypothetical protein